MVQPPQCQQFCAVGAVLVLQDVAGIFSRYHSLFVDVKADYPACGHWFITGAEVAQLNDYEYDRNNACALQTTSE